MSTPDPVASIQNNSPQFRLDYLDGLRGLSALYVVIVHVCRTVADVVGVKALPNIAQLIMIYGRDAVVIFIVLSGYCLMLPVVRSQDGRLKGGVVQYIKRRARRILPPYYAALILSLLITAFIAMNRPFTGFRLNLAQFDFSPGVLLSHIFMFHNLNPQWIYAIDGPMWSVATEWQIYFLFPILLIIWRRFSLIPAVATAFIVGFAPHLLTQNGFLDAGPVPSFLALFALGMAAADIGFSQKADRISWQTQIPWKWLTIIAYVSSFILRLKDDWKYLLVSDVLTGVGTACLIIYCSYVLIKSNRTHYPPILQLLKSRWAVLLGTFSYSLYLVHHPILHLLNLPLIGMQMSISANILVLLLVGPPISILLAYIFYLFFERSFASNFSQTGK